MLSMIKRVLAQPKTYTVFVEWDGEAEVFVAHSDDIYGLNTEAPTMSALVKRVMEVAPELLELNGVKEDISRDNFLFDPRSFVVPYGAACV